MAQNISPIKRRILQYIDALSISKRSFYSKTGISRGTIESSTGITEETMAKFIESYPEINPVWLITGNGEMLIKQYDDQTSKGEIESICPHECIMCKMKNDLIKCLQQHNESQNKLIEILEKCNMPK